MYDQKATITATNQAPVSVFNSAKHLPALDGIRGIAILLVLGCHLSEYFWFLKPGWRAIPAVIHSGWFGVDLFFVLSGFLITGILWDNRGAPHYFRNFYARRTLRLFPLYYGTLIFTFVILPLALPALNSNSPFVTPLRAEIETLKHSSAYWPWFFTYTLNFFLTAKPLDPIFPAHFWTLAVEEQFYLLWPLAMSRLRYSTLLCITGAMIVGSFLLRCLLHGHLQSMAIYTFTPCRIDTLAFGALVALIFREGVHIHLFHAILKWAFPVSAFCLFIYYAYHKGATVFGVFPETVGYSGLSVVFSSLIVFALTRPAWASVFSANTLRFFGKYSYGIYVVHVFVLRYISGLFRLGLPGHFSLLSLVWPAGFSSSAGDPISPASSMASPSSFSRSVSPSVAHFLPGASSSHPSSGSNVYFRTKSRGLPPIDR